MVLWDTAGQERFRTITYGFYKNANCVILVYDIANRKSFDNIKTWLTAIKEHASEKIIKILVGNKCDLSLDEREVTKGEGYSLANNYSMPFYEVSAKDGTLIKELYQDAIQHTYENIINNFEISPLDDHSRRKSGSVKLRPSLHSDKEKSEKPHKKCCFWICTVPSIVQPDQIYQ